jgi:hypothetical protein
MRIRVGVDVVAVERVTRLLERNDLSLAHTSELALAHESAVWQEAPCAST